MAHRTKRKPLFTSNQEEIFKMMGFILRVLHMVEFYMANSLILAVPAPARDRKKTIGQVFDERNRSTIGRLIKTLRELYVLDSDFEAALLRFLEDRNRFIHGLTMERKYSFDTLRGQRNLNSFLWDFFRDAVDMARIMRGCFYASYELTRMHSPRAKIPKLSKWESEEMTFFAMLFEPKEP